MWERTRDDLVRDGAEVAMGETVVRIRRQGRRVLSVATRGSGGREREWPGTAAFPQSTWSS